MEFAADVRLTFHNAMTYNPEDSEVPKMAARLLEIFERRWNIIQSVYQCELRSANQSQPMAKIFEETKPVSFFNLGLAHKFIFAFDCLKSSICFLLGCEPGPC